MTDETHHHLFETPIGLCGVAWNARGLVAVQLPEKDPATTASRLSAKARSSGEAAPPPEMVELVGNIRKYLAGAEIDFSEIAVDLQGIDDFRRQIYVALRGIGFGRTTTYGELARAIGIDGWEGARDVGEAMGRNPVPIVIPCHRVLAAGGKLGGFSAFGGTATKKRLLALEGVSLDVAPPRLPGL